MRAEGLPAAYQVALDILRDAMEDRRHRFGCATHGAARGQSVRCNCGLRRSAAMALRAMRSLRPILRAGVAVAPFPHYEGVPGSPREVVQVDADGTRTPGEMVDGAFRARALQAPGAVR